MIRYDQIWDSSYCEQKKTVTFTGHPVTFLCVFLSENLRKNPDVEACAKRMAGRSVPGVPC